MAHLVLYDPEHVTTADGGPASPPREVHAVQVDLGIDYQGAAVGKGGEEKLCFSGRIRRVAARFPLIGEPLHCHDSVALHGVPISAALKREGWHPYAVQPAPSLERHAHVFLDGLEVQFRGNVGVELPLNHIGGPADALTCVFR